MGLVAVIAAAIIVILVLIFSGSSFSLFDSISENKKIETKTQDTVDDLNQRLQTEQDQIRQFNTP